MFLNPFKALLGIGVEQLDQIAQAMVNRVMGQPIFPTYETIVHAQIVNTRGQVRITTLSGKQYLLTITEIK